MFNINRISFLFCLTTFSLLLSGQKKVVDQIVAVVGDEIILQSDIENQYLQLTAQGYKTHGDMKCEILEEMLVQKLFLNQAELDSIEVSETTVELQLDQRLNYFIRQIGSREKLEEYFNKSTLEIKEDFRDIIREQLVTQQVQSTILGEVAVTPSDVRKYYNSLSEDSLPFINATIQLKQILLYPPFNEDAIFEAKEILLEFRKRIVEGESFAALAVLYSEDPASAGKGGEIGYMSKSELANLYGSEYANNTYALKKGGISKIVTTEFGYYLIQLIDRQDDRVNTRQILMKPKVAPEALGRTLNTLDSISALIRKDSITFDKAAFLFSQDQATRFNGGLMINSVTGNTRFHMDDFEAKDYYVIKDLKVGEVSEPFESEDDKENRVYKVVMIVNQSKPHVANLKEDYNILQEMADSHCKQVALDEWIAEKRNSTYVKIDDSFRNCSFKQDHWVK